MKQPRKKINFMINAPLVQELQLYIPARERSDFVNEALDAALKVKKHDFITQKILKMRQKYKVKATNEEVINLKNFGRP